MKLTDLEIRSFKPERKPFKRFDGGGLYVEVLPSGAKWWRLKYRFKGKESRVSLGRYPQVKLKDARRLREDLKHQIEDGVDPGAASKARRAAKAGVVVDAFEVIAREWYANWAPARVPSHAGRVFRRLEKDIFPWLGDRPIAQIKPMELLEVLRRIEARGAVETAHRTRQTCSMVFNYAVITGRGEYDAAAALRGALSAVKSAHLAAITEPKAVGDLLRTIEGYAGSLITKCALRLAPYVFVRPGELRHAEWDEIDLDAEEWRIPAEKMKSRRAHFVPLCRQAVAILRELEPLTGGGRYVFPSVRTGDRPMSNNTVNAALRRLGYAKDEMTGHGFRSVASTLLNENGFSPDVIELQLAHAERSKVRAAYNRAQRLEERRKMMDWWGEYLDGLRDRDVNHDRPSELGVGRPRTGG